ncbi:ankyrin repeat-containing domain protein [Ephemerocybe angulata]|uniref:Ankyrin repeat-containing domain protein n=1 Tax=Ephemerocybe angulata TaxID=980116 RepID=A0A8H6I1S1_9AGAR|nr:ankyrin repeat-containing domain protein [Tulosesus angulatus]
MSTGSCKIPGNPDIAGVGVRIAIYIQNLLCFIPAFWALADGKVTQGELDAAETQATTNLVLAFAILISSIVQAQTLGLTNYHASIVLNMSWMNNTNAFIYFLLYVQYKSQESNRRRVPPTWSAWARHIKDLAVSVIPGEYRARTNQIQPGHDSTDPEAGKSDDGIASVHDAQIDGGNDSRRGAKILVKRFVLLLGSLHLTLMAGLGLWLWSNIRTFGKGQGVSNECAAKHALVAILGKHVPFASEALRIASFIIYAIFLAPGINLLLPIAMFLGLYSFWRVLPIPKGIGRGETPADSPSRYPWLRFLICRVYNSIARRWSMFPPFIGLVFLLTVNLVFIVDIELALNQNGGLQDSEEAVWGFGQILAMLLLFMPLRDLTETILARRPKQRQKDLDMGLASAINAGNRSLVLTWLARGANPNARFEGNISAIHMACNVEKLDVVRTLLEGGADPNIPGQGRDRHVVENDNRGCLRLLDQLEAGTLDTAKALAQAAKNGYGAAIKFFIPSLPLPDWHWMKTAEYKQALSGIDVNTRAANGTTALLAAVEASPGFEGVIEFLLAVPGIDANASSNDGETPLIAAAMYNCEAAAKLLVVAPGIDVNAPTTDGRTPLSYAAEKGHEAILKHLLVAPGIDVSAPDNEGWSPLTYAAAKGRENVVNLLLAVPGIDVNEVVKLLLAAPGIDVNSQNIYGDTSLYHAAYGGHTGVVKLLLAVPGVDINAVSTDGSTALMAAARLSNAHDAVFELLLATPGVDVRARDDEGKTALTHAASIGQDSAVQLLLAVPGIEANTADIYGWTPLIHAAWAGHERIVRLLLATPGIEVNAATTSGGTALTFAVESGREDPTARLVERIVKLLLATPKIDVNVADNDGWTALIWAAFNGSLNLVRVLCTVPDIIVNVADIKHHLKHPPKGRRWEEPARMIRQDKCLKILEEFEASKKGRGQDVS